ncbi:hypothetical protein GCM10009527_014290 [Actinomadura nitritigenes]|uniref:Caspase family protein n=1 Tax=Actinomadura nitritigenes TaxID=134602 RepID=A0ABS3RGH0_9ACTN|nr:caspase family protein [Actinomadura nitritigenes]MBO2445246.1 caspase family protein [Actinomadura nitritigenes]
MTALPDPLQSHAVLVGVSRYPRMPLERQLPQVMNGLEHLAGLLCDPDVWGLPEDRCTILAEPPDTETIIGGLRAAAATASDTLLFYYAGHGLTDPQVGRELYLALPHSYEPGGAHTALGYSFLRKEMRLTSAVRKAVILDCCWSGLAAEGTMGADAAPLAGIGGAGVITATTSNRQAIALPGAKLTAFTGALTDLLRDGVPEGSEFLDLESIFRALHTRLTAAGFPEPQLVGMDEGASIVLARNAQARCQDVATYRMLIAGGKYEEALDVLYRSAADDEAALNELLLRLRRTGRFQAAAELEQVAREGAGALRAALHRLRSGGVSVN